VLPPFYDDIKPYEEGKVKRNKWLSRKFLTMVAAVIADVAIGLGFNVDPATVIQIAAAIAGLWILVEGVIDGVNKGK